VAQQTDNRRDASLPELVKELSSEVSTLVHQEIELAKATVREDLEAARDSLREDVEVAREELTEKGRHAGLAAGMFGSAGVAAVLALGALSVFLFLILNAVMRDWLAALIVGALWLVVAAVLVTRGRAEIKAMGTPIPQRAIERVRGDAQQTVAELKADAADSAESIKEDVQWAKTQRSSDRT